MSPLRDGGKFCWVDAARFGGWERLHLRIVLLRGGKIALLFHC